MIISLLLNLFIFYIIGILPFLEVKLLAQLKQAETNGRANNPDHEVKTFAMHVIFFLELVYVALKDIFMLHIIEVSSISTYVVSELICHWLPKF